jgi:hypothetical protein
MLPTCFQNPASSDLAWLSEVARPPPLRIYRLVNAQKLRTTKQDQPPPTDKSESTELGRLIEETRALVAAELPGLELPLRFPTETRQQPWST